MNLRPYQTECIEKFADQTHVLCGDEMGVGKTVEAIALDALRRKQAGDGDHKTLVVAPLTGVIDSWVEHFEQWTDLKVRRIDHRSAKHRARFLEPYGVSKCPVHNPTVSNSLTTFLRKQTGQQQGSVKLNVTLNESTMLRDYVTSAMKQEGNSQTSKPSGSDKPNSTGTSAIALRERNKLGVGTYESSTELSQKSTTASLPVKEDTANSVTQSISSVLTTTTLRDVCGVSFVFDVIPLSSVLKITKDGSIEHVCICKETPEVLVIHPEGLRLEENRLIKVDWLHVIFDEIHRIKNRKTQTFKAAMHVGKKAAYRSGFTGTPVMNHPDDLWALLNWLYPTKADRDSAGFKHWYQKLLNSYWRFYERFIEYEEDEYYGYRTVVGTKNEQELRDLLNQFYIRRLKKDVLSHLPPKQYQKYEVDLHPKQRRAYNDMKKELIAWIGEQEDQPLVASIAIAKLIRLQQFTLGHGQFINGEMKLSDPSAKLDALMDIVDDLGETQCVVFSTSKQAVNLAEGRLMAAGYTTAKVTGDVTQSHRTRAIKAFQTGEAQVFLATIGAGGVGLNLQNANTVIFLDRDWSPSNNLQAEDRVHRSGQEHDSVHIIDIVARDTVDQHKDRTLQAKWQWIKNTVGG